MRELTNNNLIYVTGAESFIKKMFHNIDSIEAKPSTWYIPSVAGGLFIFTTVLSTAATAYIKPNTPLWGLPATLSLGIGLSAATYGIGEALEWAYPSTTTYVINRKQ